MMDLYIYNIYIFFFLWCNTKSVFEMSNALSGHFNRNPVYCTVCFFSSSETYLTCWCSSSASAYSLIEKSERGKKCDLDEMERFGNCWSLGIFRPKSVKKCCEKTKQKSFILVQLVCKTLFTAAVCRKASQHAQHIMSKGAKLGRWRCKNRLVFPIKVADEF